MLLGVRTITANGTNGIPISFNVVPMVPLVIPLVPMVMQMVPLALPIGKPVVPLATNGTIGKVSNGTIGRTPNRPTVSLNTCISYDKRIDL